MPMPSEVVAQVHRLARQAKVKKTSTFTNIEHDEDDVDLAQANDKLTGMGGEDKDDVNDNDYDQEQSNNGRGLRRQGK